MRDFIGEDSVNKVCISTPNCHIGYKFRTEGFWFVLRSFCYNISTNFGEKMMVGGKQKRAVTCFRDI